MRVDEDVDEGCNAETDIFNHATDLYLSFTLVWN